MSILYDIFMSIVLTCSGVFAWRFRAILPPSTVGCRIAAAAELQRSWAASGRRRLSGHSADLRLVVPVVFRAGIFGSRHSGGFPVGSFASFRLVFCWAFGRSCWYAGRLSGRLRLVPPRIVAAGLVVPLVVLAVVLVSPRSGVFRLGWSVWHSGGVRPFASAGLLLGLLRLGRCPAGVGASSRPVGLPAAFPAVLRSVGWSVIRSAFRLGFVPARFGVGYALGAVSVRLGGCRASCGRFRRVSGERKKPPDVGGFRAGVVLGAYMAFAIVRMSCPRLGMSAKRTAFPLQLWRSMSAAISLKRSRAALCSGASL